MKRIIVLLVGLFILVGCANNSSDNPDGIISLNPDTHTEEPAPTLTSEPTLEMEPSPSLTTVTTPVLIKGLLVGGLHMGEWMNYDGFYIAGVVDFDGFVYDVYVEDELTGQASGELPVSFLTGETVAPDGDLSELADVKLYDESEEQVVYDMAISADWDLFPRGYESQWRGGLRRVPLRRVFA